MRDLSGVGCSLGKPAGVHSAMNFAGMLGSYIYVSPVRTSLCSGLRPWEIRYKQPISHPVVFDVKEKEDCACLM